MTGEKMSGFTKEIIIRTLFELLNEKPLAKITVKDIVERCGVNRNTFYYHFRDISDVVESALLREVDNAFEHPVEVDSMLECLEVLVKLIGENKKAMLHIYCSVQRETFTSVLDKMCQYVIKQYIVHNFEEEIMEPTKCGLIKEGLEFAGVIFFGLMITTKGVYLLEYNLRMGDPETQTTLPLLENDLAEVVNKAIKGEDFDLNFKNQHACCVVMVSGGYPGNYDKGFEIRGLENVTCPNFIAGAKLSGEQILTSGGRVINVVGLGNTLEEARETAYENIKKVHFDYEYYRKDIGVIQ